MSLISLAMMMQGDGLTARSFLTSLPTDAASLVALALAVGFVAFTVYHGLRSGEMPGGSSAPPSGASTPTPGGAPPRRGKGPQS